MLTGKLPYIGQGIIAILKQHSEAPVPQFPRDLSRYQPLIDKMMAKDKHDRISSAPEFASLLNSIRQS
jgi:serine/threonine-protein kinase PpkA